MTLAQSFRFPKPSKLKKNVLLQETIESLIKNTKLKERINSPALPQTPKTPNESIVKDVDDILEDRRSKVRFSDPEIPKEKIPTKQMILTEENLRKHYEIMKQMNPISTMERVARWTKSIPLFLDDPQTTTAPNPNTPPKKKTLISREYVSEPSLYNTLETSYSRPKSHNIKSLPLLGTAPVNRMQSSLFVSSWKNRTKTPLPTPSRIPSANPSASRGRLICCLKVEIKSGIYKMLPIHENDDAVEIATNFCKTNKLLGSIESLKRHIQSSMKTYG